MSALSEIESSRRANRSFWNDQVRGAISRYRAGISSPHNPDYNWWSRYGAKVINRQLSQRSQFNFLSEHLGGPPESFYED